MSQSTPHPTPAQRLTAAGLRVTAPRIAVLHALPTGAHLDADAVARLVRERLGSVSTQAVYDVLRALTGASLLRRIEPAGSPALYENRVADNHHHLVCRECHTVVDVDYVVGSAPCLTSSDDHDFAIDEVEVIFWGVCPTCAPRRDRMSHREEREKS